MDIETAVAQLRRKEADARQRHAGASAQAAAAQARAEAVREELSAEFGVTTLEQVRERLASLDGQLAEEAAEVTRLLELAGGAQ